VAGVCSAPPSCSGLASNCGPGANESCCASPLVSGGTFYRSYDGVSPGFTSQAYPATVSDFRLDKFEVTVGRFRRFVAAWNAGWRPSPGEGKHTHLNAGSGLANTGLGGGGFERGWDATYTAVVAPSDANLQCNATYQTWTPSPGANENRPITCETWPEAYAFCIWDGGFLPSEGEWNYAASGGSDQRVYPWSSPASSTTIDCTYANYDPGTNCSTVGAINVGSESPKGNGKYGQADLAGNVWEWNLDVYSPSYETPCTNCSNVPRSDSNRILRGGSAASPASNVLASYRNNTIPIGRNMYIGIRCARAP
jgi:formylglycine-generating enzyme required for sulfatase activity